MLRNFEIYVWYSTLLKMNACSSIERQQRINHRSTFTTTIERNEHQIVIFVCSLSVPLFDIIRYKIIDLFQQFQTIYVAVKSKQFSNEIKITNSKEQKKPFTIHEDKHSMTSWKWMEAWLFRLLGIHCNKYLIFCPTYRIYDWINVKCV